MTRTENRAYGVITPSTRQPLLEAMLRAFCWLVSNVVSLFGLISNRNTRDWHTDEAHEDQLPTSNDISQGANSGPPGPRPAVDAQRRKRTLHDHASTSGSVFKEHAFPAQAGIQSARTAHSSNKRALSPLMPTNVGIQGRQRTLSELAAASPRMRHNRSWIPTFVGMSGVCRGLLQAPSA